MMKIVESESGKFGVNHTHTHMSERSSLDLASEFISTTFASKGISQMSQSQGNWPHSLEEKGL